jgi:guanylate kinase
MTSSGTSQGKLFILVGPAGTGKNSLMKAAISAVPGLRQLPTATSRPMRINESEGREHFFMSRGQFEEMIEQDDLLEWQVVHGTNYYGMVRSKTKQVLDAGELVIADIDYLGARAAKQAYPDEVVSVFITPPTSADLVKRLHGRGENHVETSKRLLRAPQEMAVAPECDYVIVNDIEAEAADQLVAIIRSEAAGHKCDIQRGALPQLKLVARAVIFNAAGEPDDTLPDSPQADVQPEEMPHLSAIRAAQSAFGGALPPGTWHYKYGEQGGYIPPDELYVKTDNGNIDDAVYVYRFFLDGDAGSMPGTASFTPAEMHVETP